MDIRRRTAAALAGLALLIGGTTAGCATTSSNAAGTPQTTQAGAPPGRESSDTSALVAALVSTFDLDEATVKTAVDDAMSSVVGQRAGGQPPGDDQGQPPTDSSAAPSAPPGDADGSGGRRSMPDQNQLAEQLAASIATALNLDEAEVLTVVQANLPQLGGPGGQGGPGAERDAPSPQPTTTS